MNLKKIFVGLAIFMLMGASSVFAQQTPDSEIKGIINLYKGQNYLGCIDASDKIIEQNPSNIFAYYYKGLANLQLGKKDDAIRAFEQVIILNSNETLVEYAQKATACINNPEDCSKYEKEVSELDAFIKSGKFYSESVQSEVNKKKLERIKENINDELSPKKGEMPTNDEIANAVKTLAKLGINPLAGISTNYSNPQMMEMNMLLGNNPYGNNTNMLPMLLMNQNNDKQLSPELIQTMMMSQMPAL